MTSVLSEFAELDLSKSRHSPLPSLISSPVHVPRFDQRPLPDEDELNLVEEFEKNLHSNAEEASSQHKFLDALSQKERDLKSISESFFQQPPSIDQNFTKKKNKTGFNIKKRISKKEERKESEDQPFEVGLFKRATFGSRVNQMAAKKKVYSRGRKKETLAEENKNLIALSEDDQYIIILKILKHVFSESKIEEKLEIETIDPTVLKKLKELLVSKFEFESGFNVKCVKKKRKAEEECKFVVKRALKFLFKEFKRKNSHFIKGTKVLDEFEFYKHYFGGENEIEQFVIPGCKLQKASDLSSLDKTVSVHYMHKILQSEEFRKDFEEYLRTVFEEECEENRRTKLEKIALMLVQKSGKSQQLPWADSEVALSKANLLAMVKKFKN